MTAQFTPQKDLVPNETLAAPNPAVETATLDSPPVAPNASDISGRVALVLASSALAVAIFLILLVAKAASTT